MKQKMLTTVFWVRAMLWLLSVMFVFTIISKAAASFTVAQVKVDSPSSRKLLYTVEAEGRIGKNREISVLSEPEILVKSVFVSEGQKVEKGEALAELDGKNVEEQIVSLKNKRKSFLLQNQEYKKAKEQAEKKRSRDIRRAKEDYALATKKNESAEIAAKRELARLELYLKRERDKGDNADKKTIVSLKNEVSEKKKELEGILEAKRAEKKEAKRALEDAADPVSFDSRAAVNRISVREINQQVKRLQKILRQKCRIMAPEDGVVTAVLVNVGQKTFDTAAFTMTDDSAGLKFIGQINLDDARYVSAGDSIILKNEGKKVEDVRITTIEMDESKRFMNVTALLPSNTFSLGETVSMIIEQESDPYSCTVPITAVHQENNRYFVLLMETEDTVLGKQTVANKIEVDVLETNDQFAALEPSALKDDSQIIIDTDHYVAAGDRVRLKGE
ncbi:MAG: biotin/lipoyl-binding protein [Lachnospiraceae bacterium]|nr:biotin/lipoyl-binding protein [Lachnospiraceae bacterium]